MLPAAILAVGLVYHVAPPLVDRVDYIETNIYHRDDAGRVLRQRIFWRFYDCGPDNPDTGFHVVDWRPATPANRPRLDRQGRWVCQWRDHGHLRRVEAGWKCETDTSFDCAADPERCDLQHWPIRWRDGLKLPASLNSHADRGGY